MSAFIDCLACRARLIHPNPIVTDDEFKKWSRRLGWTIGPTLCPEHAKAKGQRVILAGLASKEACTLEHDPKPWRTNQGLAIGGGGKFGGGPTMGQAHLSPRSEFCQEPSHYWIYDHLTVPGMAK